MDDARILWRRLNAPGHESAALRRRGRRWHLLGSSVFAHEGAPCRLDYEVICSEDFRTERATVSGWVGDLDVDVDMRADAGGRWHLGGEPRSHLTGCLDVDLNFSPSTNLLPIRRLALEIGQQARVRAAWLRFPSFTLEPLDQVYRRLDARTYRYESAGGAFSTELIVDGRGMVLHYPGFCEAERDR